MRCRLLFSVICTFVLLVGRVNSGQAGLTLADKTLVVPKGTNGTTTSVFVTNRDEPAKNRTTGTVRWDDKALTIVMDCADKELVAKVTKRDGPIFYEDSVWIQIDPGHTHDSHCEWIQFLSNPLGTIYDRKRFNKLDFNIEGLVIEPKQDDDGWQVKLTIPWEGLGGRPKVGDVWALGMNRVDYPRKTREFLCWTPNFHKKNKDEGFLDVHCWGHIVFADQKGNDGGGLKKMKGFHDHLMKQVARRPEYAKRISKGEGFMPWQSHDKVSAIEKKFRDGIEKRKDDMLARRVKVNHPVIYTKKDIKRAKRNIAKSAAAQEWFDGVLKVADHIVNQPDDYVEKMISALTPANYQAQFCPSCTDGAAVRIKPPDDKPFTWDYQNPDILTCKKCGQVYPDPKYPETAKLVCPRYDQTFTYYETNDEREHPEDRSGKYAYHWIHPQHVSFSGLIRLFKARFMMGNLNSLALAYSLTDDPRYARRAVQILDRLASCYKDWLFHDYYNCIADCDPLYAAIHYDALELEWKKHLCTYAFDKDPPRYVVMLQWYWGAGRMWTSTDIIGNMVYLCKAYSLIHDATDEDGRSLWDDATRTLVERELFMEGVMMAEGFMGGVGKATNGYNMAPRCYHGTAAVGIALGLTDWVDIGMRGYELIRDSRIGFDGFSKETPNYNGMYYNNLMLHADTMEGFCWPKGIKGRSGRVDLYKTDPSLKLMLRAGLDSLQANGQLLSLGDSLVGAKSVWAVPTVGVRRLPQYFGGTFPVLSRSGGKPRQYEIFHCDIEDIELDAGLDLPEIYFPCWMTTILRHGKGNDATVLAMDSSGWGRHRHRDSLGIFYGDSGQTILGDLGYVGAIHKWQCMTWSHNLVLVDDERQEKYRKPALRMMATSPGISVVEASSLGAYPKCSRYRRLVALVKGPTAQTFAIDIFRVKGGKQHSYRLFSELASSDDGGAGSLEAEGFDLPADEPLLSTGTSVAKEDVFGLRGFRSVTNPPPVWRAVWKGTNRSYRLWMLSDVDVARASDGPGQVSPAKPGRRVRYLDALRIADCGLRIADPESKTTGNNGPSKKGDLESTFVAIHEPSGSEGAMAITKATRLDVPGSAGPDAVALQIDSEWGTYVVLSEFTNEAEVAGVTFKGKFGVLYTPPADKGWSFSVGASTLKRDSTGFDDEPAVWSGTAASHTTTAIKTVSRRPKGWPRTPPGCQNHVIVRGNRYQTGWPVKKTGRDTITVQRFPLKKVTEFELPALRFVRGK